jgi:hypothetical protein
MGNACSRIDVDKEADRKFLYFEAADFVLTAFGLSVCSIQATEACCWIFFLSLHTAFYSRSLFIFLCNA